MSVQESGKPVFRKSTAHSEPGLFRCATHTSFYSSGLRCFSSGPCLSWNWRASSPNLGLKPVVGWRRQCQSQMPTRDWWAVPDLAIIFGCFRFFMAQPKLRNHFILFAHKGFSSGPGVAPFLANPHNTTQKPWYSCFALHERLTPPLLSALSRGYFYP